MLVHRRRIAAVIAAVLGSAIFISQTRAAGGPDLKSTDFPDGTGSIGLASGYHITEAYHGTVTVSHADGSVVILGMPWVILRPDSPVAQLPASATEPQARVGDMPGAMRALFASRLHSQLQSLRATAAPSALPNVPAAYFIYQFVQNGKPYTGFGYFTTIDPGYGAPNWMLYSSAVAAPTAIFQKRLPALLAMWHSWRPNGHKPAAGSETAVFDEMLEHQKQSFEKTQEEFHKIL